VLNWDEYNQDVKGFEAAAKEIVAFAKSDVRGRVVRRWFLAWLAIFPRIVLRSKRWTFTNLLERAYAKLYKHRTLAALDQSSKNQRPDLFLYCTSLSTGKACSFGQSGFIQQGTNPRAIDTPELPIAFAVAASSAFPPLFPPIAISHDVLKCDVTQFENTQYLTDGGVYDNLGIEHHLLFQDNHVDFDWLLVSDAEGVFDSEFDKKYTSIVGRNVRASDLLMGRVSTLNYRLADPDERIVKIKIAREFTRSEREDDHLTAEIQRSVRRVRTDLDSFSETEISCLIQHGYTVARGELLKRGLVPRANFPFVWDPYARVSQRPGTSALIVNARRRKLRPFAIDDWASWASLLAVAAIAVIALAVPFLFAKSAQMELQNQLTETKEKLTGATESFSVVATTLRRDPTTLARLEHAQILWVDDNPNNNRPEQQYFQQLGATIDNVPSTSDALTRLGEKSYAVIVSDMGRNEDSRERPFAGFDLLEAIRQREREQRGQPDVIFFTARSTPTLKEEALNKGALGLTNQPGELIQLVLLSQGRVPSIPDADSGWVGGGSDPKKFCNPQLAAIQAKYPNLNITMQILPEQHRSVYNPFKHDLYRYGCSFSAVKK
jgi:CheY-like chemotaxis protein/predicted acylesterase/phospholipase RssA